MISNQLSVKTQNRNQQNSVFSFLPSVFSIIYLLLSIFGSSAYAEQITSDYTLTKVRILLAEGWRLKGCRVSGSDIGPDRGFRQLRQVNFLKPGKDGWFTITNSVDRPHRWLRIEGTGSSMRPVAEVEFYSATGRLTGTPFGSPVEGVEEPWNAAFDGNQKTGCSATAQKGYVGLDLGEESQCVIGVTPKAGVYLEPVDVTMECGPAGSVIRYTLDGSVPTREHGEIYEKPVRLERSGAITVLAYKKGLAATPILSHGYAITADAESNPVTALHIGKSIKDNAVSFLEQVCWNGGKNFKCLKGTESDVVKSVDHLFLSPDQSNAENLIRSARERNFSVQVWLFAEWPGEKGWKENMSGNPLNPNPKNWEEALYLKMSRYRSLLETWNAEIKERNKVRLCPAGQALMNLKNEIDIDLVPGMKNLFRAVFHDDLKLNTKGEYLLACVQYACMFGESPENKTSPAGTGLTLEQARIFERVAWETVISEPASGQGKEDSLWFPAAGRSNETAPFEFYSPSVSISVTHTHSDDKPSVPYASGMLVNRHVWPNRFIKEYEPITRNSPGRDEKPWGTCLPLALFPRIEGNGWGGELQKEVEKQDGRTLHQIQWDYLQEHVNRAYDHYIMQSQDIWPDEINDLESMPSRADKELTPEYLEQARRGLSEYEKFIAIANYASAWQCRTKKGGPRCGTHGVDVLHYGHHCGGTSKIFMMMFSVAGFKVRMLGWNCHMSNEVKVGKKWIFADMIIRNGAHYRSTHSWAEFTADPDVYPTAVLSYMRSPTARKTNYYYSQGMYWQHIGGIGKYDKTMGQNSSALIMSYRPNAASALYPSMRLHIWHIAKGDPPSLNICGPTGGGGRKEVVFKPGISVRKQFYISNCSDNPITAASASFRLKGNGEDLVCTLDGRVLNKRKGTGYELPVELLTPGEHELILKNTGTSEMEFSFYPDIVRPYLYPVSGEAVEFCPPENSPQIMQISADIGGK